MLLGADPIFGSIMVNNKISSAKSIWDSIYETVVSPEVIRPLIVAFIIGMVAVCRKILKNQKLARQAEENVRAKLVTDLSNATQTSRTIEAAVTYFGQELQSTKRNMMDQFQQQAEYREEIRNQLQDLNMKMRSVDKELHPNGGSSMKDALMRVENTVERYHDRAQTIEEKLDEHIEEARYQIQRVDQLSKEAGK